MPVSSVPSESRRLALRKASVERVRSAIVRNDPVALTADDVWAWRIAGWVFPALPPDHALRRALSLDYTRHLVQKTALQNSVSELQESWAQAGIRYFALKGCALQHAYPDRRMRFHGDVDLYVPPAQIPAALAALPAGWSFLPFPPHRDSLNAGTLLDDKGRHVVDLHHRVTPVGGVGSRRVKSLHAALEAGATVLHPEGLPPLPAFNWTDQVLVSLVINRGWCADHWRPKAADYLDLQQLLDRGWVDLPGLQHRAEALGLKHSLQAFLSICQPQVGLFQLERALRPAGRLTWLDWAAWRDGCWNHVRRSLLWPRRAGRLAIDIAVMAPVLRSVLRQLRAHRAPEAVVRGLPRRPGLGWHEARYVRAARWGARLLRKFRLTQAGVCVVQSLTVASALRNDGIAVTWLQGYRVKSLPGALPGHAWLEVGGKTLDYYGDGEAARDFTVSLRIEIKPE